MSYSKQYEISADTTLNVQFSAQTSGSTLIFLHFWGGSSHTFSATISHLPNYRCIAIDHRGWGSSTGPADPTAYSIHSMAQDFEALLPELGVGEFVLIGHSMGGKVAQLVAGRNFVKGLKGLVLIAPAPPTPFELPPDMKEQQLSAYSTPQSAEFVVRNVLSASELSGEVVGGFVRDMMRGNEFAKKAWPAYGMGEGVVGAAKRIKVRVLVVAGEEDRVERVERLRGEVLGNIEGSEMVVLKGVGHLIPVEAPGDVAKYIEEFCGRVL